MEVSKIHMDRMSRRWWSSQVAEYIQKFFSLSHGDLIDQICWQVNTMEQWISGWMSYINSLCWDEWKELDVDLQRLYVLLDYAYEEPQTGNWNRILKHPKYSDWVAKAVAFTLHQEVLTW